MFCIQNDRMAKDCAVELEKYNITFVSLWPGMVQTEFITEFTESGDLGLRNAMKTEVRVDVFGYHLDHSKVLFLQHLTRLPRKRLPKIS